MEKYPYQRFICANAKNIGPAPWTTLREVQGHRKSHKEGSKEERREGHGEGEDEGKGESKDQGQEEGQEESKGQGQEEESIHEGRTERTWKRHPVSVNVHLPRDL